MCTFCQKSETDRLGPAWGPPGSAWPNLDNLGQKWTICEKYKSCTNYFYAIYIFIKILFSKKIILKKNMDVHKIFFKILKNNMDPIFIFLNFYL